MNNYKVSEPDPMPCAARGREVICSSCDEPMPLERGDSAPFVCEACRRVTPTALQQSSDLFAFACELTRVMAAVHGAKPAGLAFACPFCSSPVATDGDYCSTECACRAECD